MTLFNLRISPELQHKLQAEATKRGISRSDIAREALLAHLTVDEAIQPEEIHDDWSDLGSEIIAAQHKILKTMISKIDDAEWDEIIEPIYQRFRTKTIAKSRAYANPTMLTRKTEAPFNPFLIATIGLASDDVHEIKVSLEQLLFEYCWFAGDAALMEIHSVVDCVKARIEAGEREPSIDMMIAARD